MWPCGPPKRYFSAYFDLRVAAKSTLKALLVPLFGQFRKGNSPKVARFMFFFSLAHSERLQNGPYASNEHENPQH